MMAGIRGSVPLSKQASAAKEFAHMCLLPYRPILPLIQLSSCVFTSAPWLQWGA